MIAGAYQIRRSLKDHSSEKEQEIMRILEAYKRSFIQSVKEIYKELINEDEVARELVEGVSFSPLI